MPRVSRAETAKHREAIEEAASRMFRAAGFRNVSVADVMGAAGLTHGGFYGHFASKDALAAAACERGFAEGVESWTKRVAKSPDAPRDALVRGYLSDANRAAPGHGCPLTGLAVDVAREPADRPVKAAYRDGLDRLLEILVAAEPDADADARRREGLADLAAMVGAMVLARATAGEAISDEILAATRDRLLSGRSPCGSRDRE